jgi:hypothetical protein
VTASSYGPKAMVEPGRLDSGQCIRCSLLRRHFCCGSVSVKAESGDVAGNPAVWECGGMSAVSDVSHGLENVVSPSDSSGLRVSLGSTFMHTVERQVRLT